jgi:sialidase-1
MNPNFSALPPFRCDDFKSNTFTPPLHETIFYSTEHTTNYNSFPNAVLTPDGKIVLAFRQARDLRHVYGETRHVDVTARAVTLTSHDEGETWEPQTRVIYDHFIYGAQDPCLNLLRDGTILGTFFQWTVLAPEEVDELRLRDLVYYDHWIARPTGLFSTRSYDNGVTWDEPIPVCEEPMSIRGKGVAMPDGSFVVAAYKYLPGCVIHVMRTTDLGRSWEEIAEINHPNGCDEPFLHLTPSGKLVIFIRSDRFDINDLTSAPLMTAESLDGGYTWSHPVERPFYSPSPFDVLRLQSGKVLVAYGHRFPPYGIRAFLLDSECNDWDNVEETIIRDNCEDEDIGYTTSVQLKNGDIKTFYYYMESETGGYRYIACSTYRENDSATKDGWRAQTDERGLEALAPTNELVELGAR